VPSTADLDQAFTRTLAIPEFRSSSSGYAKVASKVLSYLNTLEDLPENTAVEILENELVMAQVRDVPEADPSFAAAIDSAIVEANRRLDAENQELRTRLAGTPNSVAVAEVGGRAGDDEQSTLSAPVVGSPPSSEGPASEPRATSMSVALTTRLSALVVCVILLILAAGIVLLVPRVDGVQDLPQLILRGAIGAIGALFAVVAVAVFVDGVIKGNPAYLVTALGNRIVFWVASAVIGALIIVVFGIPAV
jgi:hypothetical protein